METADEAAPEGGPGGLEPAPARPPKQNDKKRNRADTQAAGAGATMTALFNHLPEGIDMKTWIRRSLIGVAVTVLLAGGLSACGHRGGEHAHGAASAERVAEWRGEAVKRVSRKLELDAEQKRRLEVLADKLVAQRAAMIGATTDPRAEMKALVAGPTFDRTRALALAGEKTRVLQSATPEVVGALADFYDSLNPKQQAEVREFLEQRRGWRRG
jgi:Spy/CpxP family protein refolding chaperone